MSLKVAPSRVFARPFGTAATLTVAFLAIQVAAFSAAAISDFPTQYRPVTIDGVRMGTQLTAAFGCAGFTRYATIAYDEPTAKFHMWYYRCDGADSRRFVDMYHAVSSDGLNFLTTGNLSYSAGSNPFTGPSPWAFASIVEPRVYYPKVSKDGGVYRLMLANYPRSASIGDYAFNMSVDDIGPDPNNLVLTHRGPVGPTYRLDSEGGGGGANRANNSGFGIVNGKLYYGGNGNFGGEDRLVRSDFVDWGILPFPHTIAAGMWQITNIPGPALPVPSEAYDPPPVFDPLTRAGYARCGEGSIESAVEYGIRNLGRVLQTPDRKLTFFFIYSQCGTDAAAFRQVFYSESADNGITWSDPAPAFPSEVTVDGRPVATDAAANFTFPEAVARGSERLLYFATKVDADGYGLVWVGPAKLAASGPYALATAVSPAIGGTISPAAGSVYPTGEIVPVTATPAFGYYFSHWSGAVSGSTNPVTVTMDADKRVVANFRGMAPSLYAKILSKQPGATGYRVYHFRVENRSAFVAQNVLGVSLIASSAAITVTHPSWPSPLGSIAAGSYQDFFVTFKWPESVAATRLTLTLSADGPYLRSFVFNVFR